MAKRARLAGHAFDQHDVIVELDQPAARVRRAQVPDARPASFSTATVTGGAGGAC